MAVDGYQQLIVAPCIDNDVLQTNFDSINALSNEMSKGTVDVNCNPVNVSIKGESGVNEISSIIFDGESTSLLGSKNQKCLFLLSINFNHRVFGGDLDSNYIFKYTIKCNGVTVHERNIPTRQLTSDFVSVDCPIGSEIEITSGIASPINNVNVEWFATICGGALCITEEDVTTSGIAVPCKIKPECKYGFDAIALMAQSLNSLGASLTFGGKTVRCVSINATDNESVAVSANMDSNTTYAVFGHIDVCFDDPRNVNNSVIVQPVIGCESSQASCTAGVARYESANSGIFKECTRFPVITCGECKRGESLYVGQIPELRCNEVAAPDAGTNGYSLNAEYCIWLFEDVTNDNELVPYPPKCITTNYLVKLRDKGNDVHDKACDRQTPNCTIRDRSFLTDGHANGPQPPLLIQEAVPFTPPIDQPDATPASKKWYLTGSVQICHERQTTNIEEKHFAIVTYRILCGGVPYVNASGQDFYGEIRWLLAGSGSFTSCSPELQIVGNIECPPSDDLEIVITGSSSGFGLTFDGPWTTIVDIKAICF